MSNFTAVNHSSWANTQRIVNSATKNYGGSIMFVSDEDQYGTALSDLPLEDLQAYQKAKEQLPFAVEDEELSLYDRYGDQKVLYGDYMETTRMLYDGKYYSDLTKEEKKLVKEWKQECKDYIYKTDSAPTEFPECPFDESTEVWVRKLDKKEKKTYKNYVEARNDKKAKENKELAENLPKEKGKLGKFFGKIGVMIESQEK